MGWEFHVCEVCRLLDGDSRLKPCQFCSLCGSWICAEDLPDWYRRSLAAILAGRGLGA